MSAHALEPRGYTAAMKYAGMLGSFLWVAACGSARAMIAAAKAVRRGDFAKELDDQLAPALAKITAGCRADK